MASDLPRVRLHDDGRVALALERFDPSRNGHWRSIVPPSATSDGHTGGLLSTVEVYTPGWRDAVIVPLPEPGNGLLGVLRPTEARELAAKLLRGAMDRGPANHG